MKTNSINLYFDRQTLYAKFDELNTKREAAEEEDNKLWKWYEGMTEEEYHTCEAEADAKVRESSDKVRYLREVMDETWKCIKWMEKLESSLKYLESNWEV